jgi:class 3 adenylate cyclase
MKFNTRMQLLYSEAKTGDQFAVDQFFNEVLENVALVQGIGTSEIVRKVSWFRDHPEISKRGFAFSFFITGFVESFLSMHRSSIVLCTQANQIFELANDIDGVALCALVIGTNYRGLGNVELATQYMKESYHQLRATDKILHFSIASGHQLAELYFETEKFQEALKICEEVLELISRPANAKKIFDARVLNTAGNIFAKLGCDSSAVKYFTEAISRSKELKQLPVTARVLTDIGGYYQTKSDLYLAKRYNERALKIRYRLKLENPSLTNIINISNILLQQEKADEAIELLLKGYGIAKKLNANIKMLQILKKLSWIFEERQELPASLVYYKQYSTLLEQQNKDLYEQKIGSIKLFLEAEQAIKQNELIKAQKEELEKEKKLSDSLLRNILPEEVAEELKNGTTAIAKYFSDVTVLFTDFVDFTSKTDQLTPQQLVNELHTYFKAFDAIVGKYGIEKIKTIGDAYLAVCGLPAGDSLHAEKVANAAIDIRAFVAERNRDIGDKTFDIRIGIHSGSVVAGIVGVKKFAYDIWGDTVNTAARIEQNSEPGKINVSETTHQLIKGKFQFDYRGKIFAKGKGMLDMYFLK